MARLGENLKLEMVALLPRLRAFARSLTGSMADADDLVQQTCERALSTEAVPPAEARIDAWLFRIMRNLFIDTYRRRRPMAPLDDRIAETIAGSDGRNVGEARLEWQAVRALIADLPEDQRSVLVLVCVEGLRYREVAEVMDIPLGTVMSRLARARGAVAAALDGEAGDAARQSAGE
jgi:RNA polymerase sigma-70 factor (ECF subfamily)